MHPEALSCRDWFHWTSRRSIYPVRDEEVVGSNPATPTVCMQVSGRFPISEDGHWRALARAIPADLTVSQSKPVRLIQPYTQFRPGV
jgi:hypothetical protein